MRHVIALDVGGTAMKGALVGADGALLHRDRRPTARERGPEAVIEGILGFADDLRAYGVQHLGGPALAAGLAVPGIIDEPHGVAVYAANLGWRDAPLRALLADRVGAPAALGHDVRTGGLAEGRLGAARDTPRFLFLALGTGIAGALGTPAGIEPGAHGSAGEIGHVVVRPDGLPCPCGQHGCLERYASAAAVSEAWARVSGGGDAADCAKAVDAGDERAREVWHRAITALADGLMTAITLLDPATIVIGGGLAEAGDTLFTPLREAVSRRVTFQHLPKITPAALGDTAGCLGAGLMAWDLLRKTDGMEETP
ncbi:ROK family protein [Streptomyces roseirectus]|uniref:ROK family protein n=1 Tax=Streptomyces roseirectus TaxID=2768066 RepID=A0A7H0IGM8_9ACTN|nr:ROK family protein [Streptomyces roseirectus]QNP71944.1 ROK family protein [Streptomyces roseirectus]